MVPGTAPRTGRPRRAPGWARRGGNAGAARSHSLPQSCQCRGRPAARAHQRVAAQCVEGEPEDRVDFLGHSAKALFNLPQGCLGRREPDRAEGASVAWAVTAGGGQVSPQTTRTDARGHARTAWSMGTSTRPARATATVDEGVLAFSAIPARRAARQRPRVRRRRPERHPRNHPGRLAGGAGDGCVRKRASPGARALERAHGRRAPGAAGLHHPRQRHRAHVVGGGVHARR